MDLEDKTPEKKSKVAIPVEPIEESVVKIVEEPMYLKYVGGSGITLEYALEDGRRVLPGHEPIEIKNYLDFVRLTSANDGLFIECDANGKPKDNKK
jgi:hypothetical protein